MSDKDGYRRRTILSAVGSVLGLSAVQVQNAELVAAGTESLTVNRAPFTEIAVGHVGIEDAPLTVSCDAFPYAVGDGTVSLVDHEPDRYRARQAIASVNGSIHDASGTVLGGVTRRIPVEGDRRGQNTASLTLPDGVSYELPEVGVRANATGSTVHVEGDRYEVTDDGVERIELSEREFTVADESGERERTFTLTPVLEVEHHGVVDVLGKEGHAVFPLEFIEKRLPDSQREEIERAPDRDVVVVPKEVSN